MPSMKPIRHVTGSMAIAVVALGMVALSTLAVATPAGAAATKPTATKPSTVKPTALSRASRVRLDREIRYDCRQARKFLRGQGGLEARYSKRLVKLQRWEAQAKADGSAKSVTRLETDIGRVEARKALVTKKAPAAVVAQTQKAQATQAKCAVMAAEALRHSKGTPAGRKAAREAKGRARLKAAEAKAAEAKAAATAKAKAAKGKATKGKATTPAKSTTTTSTTTPPAKSTTTPSTTTSTKPPSTSTSSTPLTAAKS
jgi:hypothetical protein